MKKNGPDSRISAPKTNSERDEIITISVAEVARALHTSPMKIKSGILNGTLPIGTVLRGENSSQDRTIIIKERFDKWIKGKL